MGIVHVLTGPDHLSALATLSANVGNCRAFWYGVRWGIGHSIGLVVVGSIFIFLSHSGEDENAVIEIPETVETIGESFVGLFMLALGSYSLIKTCRNYAQMDDEERLHAIALTSSGFEEPMFTPSRRRSAALDRSRSDQSVVSISHQRVTSTSPQLRPSIFPDEDDDRPLPITSGEGSMSLADAPQKYKPRPLNISRHGHGHDHIDFSPTEDGLSKKFLSIGIGIVHGVAGPGGILGVVPAVQLHDLWLSILYLGTFCITSTIVMGTFAAAYGILSSRLSENNRTFEFRMEVFSSGLSIFVGALWLILLYTGTLHDIFP